jgi:hypothetical protein
VTVAIDTVLLLIGAISFGIGVVIVVGAPMIAGTVAERTTRPELARRASGPDRMRNLIASQQASRSRRSLLAARLRLVGVAMVVVGGTAFVSGVAIRSVPG